MRVNFRNLFPKQYIYIVGLNIQIRPPQESRPGGLTPIQIVGSQIGSCKNIFTQPRCCLMPLVNSSIPAIHNTIIHHQLIFGKMQQYVQHRRGFRKAQPLIIIGLTEINVPNNIQLHIKLVKRAIDTPTASPIKIRLLIYRVDRIINTTCLVSVLEGFQK